MANRKMKVLFKSIGIGIYLLILLICAVEINFLWLFGYSPTRKDIQYPTLNMASSLFTADSLLLGSYYSENRAIVTYDEISPAVVDALVATEDIRFFKHSGVDFLALASSLASTAQGERRGGSTITQQLAKNLYKTRYDEKSGLLSNIPGFGIGIIKFKEWITAYKLENKYSKEELITMYLNTVSFGSNAYGIEVAANKYFSTTSAQLTVPQAALLIGMLKATTLYNPFRNPEQSLQRRNVVLSQMRKASFISQEEFDTSIASGLDLHTNPNGESSSNDSYLRTAVMRFLKGWAEENGYDLYRDGLSIYTTIDSKMQSLAEKAVAEQMKILQNRFQQAWQGELPWRTSNGQVIENFLENLAEKLPVYEFLKQKYQGNTDSISKELNRTKEMKVFTWEGLKEVNYSSLDSLAHYAKLLNTGMMSMDPFSGEIKTWVGGINHNYFKFDHVDQAKRQAGSTFKPFAYLTALQQGMSPCDVFQDKPVKIQYLEGEETKTWEPKNADWVFSYQDMSLRHAMGRSINSVTAQVTEKVGWDNVVKSAHLCGIESHLAAVPSVSLGASDVSVWEMVRAYATFLNTGYKVNPILVQRIVDRDGKEIANFQTKKERVLSEEVAWLMLYMLRGTMEEPGGTSQSLWEWDLWRNKNQIAGKTGTSSDYVDGWYMGMNYNLVTGVWVGNDNPSIHFRSSATGEGAHTALPIFGRFMESLYREMPEQFSYAPFPEATVKITRKYLCPTPRTIVPDSVVSFPLDSFLMLPDPATLTPEIIPKIN